MPQADTLEREGSSLLDRARTLLRPSPRTRPAPCPTCGVVNDLVVAKWCGHCGERLAALREVEVAPEREGPDLDRLRRIAAGVFAGLVVLLLVVPALLRGSNGTQLGQTARGDGGRSGVVATRTPDAPTGIAWEQATLAPNVPTPRLALTDEHVTILGARAFATVERTTGRILQSVELATESLPYEDANVVGGVVLLGGDDTPVQALDPVTGEQLWVLEGAFPAGFVRASAMADPNGLLHLPFGFTSVVVVDPATGEIQNVSDGWPAGSGIHSAIAANEQSAAFLTVSPPGADLRPGVAAVTGGITVVGEQGGRVVWNIDLISDDALAPTAMSRSGTRGWIAHLDSTRGPNPLVVVRDLLTGQEQTTVPISGELFGLGIVDDTLLVSAEASGVIGIDVRNGQEVFRSDLDPGPILVGPDDPVFAVGTVDGGPTTLLDTGGGVVTSIPDVVGTPVLADGTFVSSSADGIVTARDLGGSPLWERPVLLPSVATLATDGDLVVVNGQNGTVVLDPETGERITAVERTASTVSRGIDGTVVLGDGIVVTTPLASDASGRSLTALDAQTGIARWNEDRQSPPVVGPLTGAAGRTWIPVDDEIHAYENSDGRRTFAEFARGSESVQASPRGPLTLVDGMVVATPRDEVCVAADDCPDAVIAIEQERELPGGPREVRWVSSVPACGAAAAGRDGGLFVPTRRGIASLDVLDGSTLWVQREFATCDTLAVGPRAVVQAAGTRLLALDPVTGDRLWTTDLEQLPATAPVIAGDELVVGMLDGSLLGFDLETGAVRWQFGLPAPALTEPVVVDGSWVVLLRDGRVLRLR